MKAYEARQIVYQNNSLEKAQADIDKLIEKAAKKGKFHITILVRHDWGSEHDIAALYKKLGFKTSTSHQQTSPNDGDDYVTLDWSE